jgi:thiol-disulfide isomerase/thioredoxin
MNRRRFVAPALVASAALMISAPLFGQNKNETKSDTTTPAALKPLHVGDPAPALDIKHWVKGDKVAAFEPGKVYVVEFWATWCGPCKRSMPHLTKLQQQYKDYGVTFIGVSDEDLKTVKNFMAKTDDDGTKWADKMGYTVTTDPDQSVYESYMFGVGAGGIPTAFIVGKDTKIEWVGNPLFPEGEIDKALEGVVKDTWDRKTFAAEFEPKADKDRQQMQPYIEARMKTKPYRMALSDAKDKGDWTAAAKAYDDLIANSKNPLQFKVEKFQMLVGEANMPDKGYAVGEELAKENWDKAQILNQLAWFVVDDEAVKTRNLDFAQKLATRACELTDNKRGEIIDTLARVYAEKHDYVNAVKYEKMAVEAAPDEMAAELKKTLADYEAKANSKH